MADFLLAIEVVAGIGHIVTGAGCPDGRYVISGYVTDRRMRVETRVFDTKGALAFEIAGGNPETGAICARNLLPFA